MLQPPQYTPLKVFSGTADEKCQNKPLPPPHSQNLCACDCNLIPKLKQSLHRKWNANRRGISTAVQHEVAWISTSVEYDGILCLLHCWHWTTDTTQRKPMFPQHSCPGFKSSGLLHKVLIPSVGVMRSWLGHTRVGMSMRGDNAGLMQALRHSSLHLSIQDHLCMMKSYILWEVTLFVQNTVDLEETLKKIHNPMVWASCLSDEWQWVSLSRTAHSGIPGDLPDVLSLTKYGRLCLVDLIFPL